MPCRILRSPESRRDTEKPRQLFRLSIAAEKILVGGVVSVLSVCDTDAVVRRIEYSVEPLEEHHPVDDIHPQAGRPSDVGDDEVDVVRATSYHAVQVTLQGHRMNTTLTELI